MRTITAREASRNFAKLLREVEGGVEFLVTCEGIPVARIVAAPAEGTRRLTPAQEKVLAGSKARLRRGWSLGGGRITRSALHER